MKHLGLTLKPSDLQTPFFFYCCKLQAEYTDFKQTIKEDQDLFSDVYECRTWGGSNKVHTLHFKLKGIPQCNETIDISSPDGKIGRVDGIERNEEKNVSISIRTLLLNFLYFVFRIQVFKHFLLLLCWVTPMVKKEHIFYVSS